MAFTSSTIPRAVILFFIFFSHLGAAVLQNFTADDQSFKISYTGSWAPVSEHANPLNFGGSHTFTRDKEANATFTFEGVGVYYMAPLWPYAVSSRLSLDGGPQIYVSMATPTGPVSSEGVETVQSAVLWGASGLVNARHTLVVSVSPDTGYAVVDGFIFTVDDGTPATSSSEIPSPTSASTPSPSIASPRNSSEPHTLQTTVIALTASLAFLALVSGLLIFWLWRRYHHVRLAPSQAWAAANFPPRNSTIIPFISTGSRIRTLREKRPIVAHHLPRTGSSSSSHQPLLDRTSVDSSGDEHPPQNNAARRTAPPVYTELQYSPA
ncbi:hypothetical protein HGRIS_012254 [Hohenbuehelia grisea]|uniref:Transmembrane protein n=1 Tax=Hohenbuehelia grisea TaxID=104357 RepID=A0ABR3IRN9_9AGAR